MKNARYKNQNIAVLGAGLSGSAAALLLKAEGAQVTVPAHRVIPASDGVLYRPSP